MKHPTRLPSVCSLVGSSSGVLSSSGCGHSFALVAGSRRYGIHTSSCETRNANIVDLRTGRDRLAAVRMSVVDQCGCRFGVGVRRPHVAEHRRIVAGRRAANCGHSPEAQCRRSSVPSTQTMVICGCLQALPLQLSWPFVTEDLS